MYPRNMVCFLYVNVNTLVIADNIHYYYYYYNYYYYYYYY